MLAINTGSNAGDGFETVILASMNLNLGCVHVFDFQTVVLASRMFRCNAYILNVGEVCSTKDFVHAFQRDLYTIS